MSGSPPKRGSQEALARRLQAGEVLYRVVETSDGPLTGD